MKTTTTFASMYREFGAERRNAVPRLQKRAWRYPLALELRYARAIKKFLMNSWGAYADYSLKMFVPINLDAASLDLGPDDAQPAVGAIIGLSQNLSKFNLKEMKAFQSIAIGEAWEESEAWVEKTLSDWATNQISLITKASNDLKQSVALRVRDGVKKGWGAEAIRAIIHKDLPGMSVRRSKIIARDQAAKLNGLLSQGRMEDAGLETYIWGTAMDERVRGLPGGKFADAVPSHFVMEGKVCRWDNPSVYRNASGEWVPRPSDAPHNHPGMEILCRCVALPNWGELNEIDTLNPEESAEVELKSAREALLRAQTALSYIAPANPAVFSFQEALAQAKAQVESLGG